MGTVRPKRSSAPGRGHRGHALGQGDVRGQGVDPDAVGGQLQGRRLGEVDDAGLGRGVGGVARGGPHPLDRGHVDDAARRCRLHHGPGHPLGAQDDVLEVGPVEGVPAVLRGLEERGEEHPAGVVDQDADRPELGGWSGPGPRRPRSDSRTSVVMPEATDLLGGRGGGVGVALPDGHPAPKAARPRAMPRPMPAPPPVTTATRSVEEHGGGVHGHGDAQPNKFAGDSFVSTDEERSVSIRSRGGAHAKD